MDSFDQDPKNGPSMEVAPLRGRAVWHDEILSSETLDADAHQAMQKALDDGVRLFRTDLSELKEVILLLRLRPIYEKLHPGTGHGGDRRKQGAKMASWPSFPKYIAKKTGKWTVRTVQRRFAQGAQIRGLGKEVIVACLDTILANRLGTLERLVEVPEDQRLPLIEQFRSDESKGWKRLRSFSPPKPRAKAEEPSRSEEHQPISPTESVGPSVPNLRASVASMASVLTRSPQQMQVPVKRVKEGYEMGFTLPGIDVQLLIGRDLKIAAVAYAASVSQPPQRMGTTKVKSYPNDDQVPKSEDFLSLVRETIEELPNCRALGIDVLAGAQGSTCTTANLVCRGRTWELEWWQERHYAEARFRFKPMPTKLGGHGAGYPATVALLRRAIRDYVKSHVLRPLRKAQLRVESGSPSAEEAKPQPKVRR